MKAFRCRLFRDDGMQIDYIGPAFAWSREWHLFRRWPAKAAA